MPHNENGMRMAEYAVQTSDLTRRFGPVTAVDSLSLAIPRGIVFGFLGPNGAGKTTTIHLLLGLLEPSSGNARVLGFDLRSEADSIRENTGALLEHTGLYERLSAEDNLEFYARVNRIETAGRRDRIRELLTQFGLWERRRDRVSTWSRGMKQKLAVARALLHRPPLIFLDEPTSGLDPVAAAALRDDLAGLVEEEGLTVFLTTHNLNEAEKLCNIVGVINKGRLIAVGRPDGLRGRTGTVQVTVTGDGFTDGLLDTLKHRAEVAGVSRTDGSLTVSLDGSAPMAPLVKLLVEGGASIEEVVREKESLEDSFLTLMEEENDE